MKSIWKMLGSRIWLIVTSVALALLIIVNVLASGVFYSLVCTFLGWDRLQYLSDGPVNAYDKIEGADTKATALQHGNEITEQICEEGFTLLKNQAAALPLKQSAAVSVFGKNSVNIAISGSGSSGASAKGAKTIFDSLTAAGFTYNTALKEFYDSPASGKGRDSNPSDLDNGKTVTLSTGETPLASYNETLWSSCNAYNDAALIVLTRIGGEGFDLPRNYLKLDENEKELINKVKSMSFKKVIVLINAANTLEINELKNDDGVDAILWTGFAGQYGMMALGKILNGSVTPSGHTVDTYATLESNPSWNNFGAENEYGAYVKQAKRGTIDTGVYYVRYEEDIYVGYRYYETAYAEHEEGNYADFDYDGVVAYPFGYGLSYTTFGWSLENADEIPAKIKADTSLTFKIKVTNTGTEKGRDVVQLYVTPPHTHGGLEKSAKVLVGFAKTDVLAPGASQTVEITVDSPYAFASYDCYGKSGHTGYVLEKGDYVFGISTDAHNLKDMAESSVKLTVDELILFDKDLNTNYTVENLFTGNEDEWENSDTELETKLSRSDFKTTWPKITTNPEVEDTFVDKIKSTDPNPNNDEADSYTDKVTGKKNGLTLADVAELDFDDEKWDEFIDQLTFNELLNLLNNGGFQTMAIARLGVIKSTSSDGIGGWANFMSDSKIYGTCAYCSEVVTSSTWNVERAFDMGESVGNEGLVGDADGDKSPYTGWYAPGLNIHRSPMGGRNCEYYSEDPLISGYMTASVMKGAASKGVYVTMKHFAANEQETHRSVTGLLTWTTEQSLRELYLKGFEIAIKTAQKDITLKANGTAAAGGEVKAMGVMSSFNRIGTRWTGGDYRLITKILRKEWGFHGIVLTDFNTVSYMVLKDMAYAGGNHNLQIAGTNVWKADSKSAADITVLKQGAKEILYVVANSNAFTEDFKILMPIWQICMIVADCAIICGLGVWGFFAVKKALKNNGEPQEESTVAENTDEPADI